MPIREKVSEELLQQMMLVFNRTYSEYKNYKCASTISLLIVHLYELALVAFTLHYSCGIATYSVVKSHLPYLQSNQEFVKFRDDIVHNLYNVTDFNMRLEIFLQNFTRENFNCICQECNIDTELFDELLQFCNKAGQVQPKRLEI